MTAKRHPPSVSNRPPAASTVAIHGATHVRCKLCQRNARHITGDWAMVLTRSRVSEDIGFDVYCPACADLAGVETNVGRVLRGDVEPTEAPPERSLRRIPQPRQTAPAENEIAPAGWSPRVDLGARRWQNGRANHADADKKAIRRRPKAPRTAAEEAPAAKRASRPRRQPQGVEGPQLQPSTPTKAPSPDRRRRGGGEPPGQPPRRGRKPKVYRCHIEQVCDVFLAHEADLTARDVADLSGLNLSQVSGSINALNNEGRIERVDARNWRIRRTR